MQDGGERSFGEAGREGCGAARLMTKHDIS